MDMFLQEIEATVVTHDVKGFAQEELRYRKAFRYPPATRLALVRFASGDLDGAERELWTFADQAPREEREELLLEAYEIAQALVRAHPALASMHRFVDRIAAELMR